MLKPMSSTAEAKSKSRAKENWTARSEPIKCGKAALKALKDKQYDEVTQVNFVKCMEMMSLEDKKFELFCELLLLFPTQK